MGGYGFEACLPSLLHLQTLLFELWWWKNSLWNVRYHFFIQQLHPCWTCYSCWARYWMIFECHNMLKSTMLIVEKDGIFSLSWAWDKEKNPSPWQDIGRSNHWATGRLVASEVIFTRFVHVVTRVLRTDRIGNEESTVCDDKERKMVDLFSLPFFVEWKCCTRFSGAYCNLWTSNKKTVDHQSLQHVSAPPFGPFPRPNRHYHKTLARNKKKGANIHQLIKIRCNNETT